jgi:predicted DNA-binding protein (MmcQ/YjbR family)
MKHSPSQAAAAELRTYALSFPESNEEFPWGESAFKVKGKVFLFMRAHEEGVGLSVKLPQSNAAALDKGFAQPTGYGLGKSGWVSCTFEGGERVPIDIIKPWILESWRAVAPKTLVKRFDGGDVAMQAGSAGALPRKVDSGSARKVKAPPLAKAAKKTSKPVKKTARASAKSTTASARKPAKVDAKSGGKPAANRARKRA